MNTQQIISFIQVADHLSFSKAAEQMYLSIPTISRNIRLLEEELGAALFLRDRHRVLLTPEGQRFYVDAKLLLHTQEQAKLHIQKAGKQTQIRIGCTSQEEQPLLAAVLAELRKKRPNVVPKIFCDNYAKQVTLLKQQGLDLLLGSENMAREDSEIQFQQLCIRNSMALVPESDSLAQREVISFADLENKVIIAIPQKMIPFKSRNIIKDLLAVHHEHSMDIECEDEQSCVTLVRAGYGIAILPDYKIPDAIIGFQCVPVRENEAYGYGVLKGPGASVPAANDFIQILKRHLGK